MPLMRNELFQRIIARKYPYDIAIIGGGAAGLGAAFDAASRGYSVVLLERGDFAGETSSRSTKLLHGGVRYIRHGHIGLLREALRERESVRNMAPHLSREQALVVPARTLAEKLFYHTGLKLYDLLAGRSSFPRAALVDRETLARDIPALRSKEFIGGIRFFDGQFDDARFALALARTANSLGATVLNYLEVVGIDRSSPKELEVLDRLLNQRCAVKAKVVINAAGTFSDQIRTLEQSDVAPALRFSRGTHITLDRKFLGGSTSLLVPKTSEGKVLYAIPWYDKVLVGTTEIEVPAPVSNPVPSREEVSFLLSTLEPYLSLTPSASDVCSAMAGLRPLVRGSGTTAQLSREDKIEVSPFGLVSALGGKWTTFRAMAKRVVDVAEEVGKLGSRPSRTRDLMLIGYDGSTWDGISTPYGSDYKELVTLCANDPQLGEKLHPRRPYTKAQVVWAARAELAQTVDDVLSRRMRALSCDIQSAIEMAPLVARLLASELGHSPEWEAAQVREFQAIANGNVPIGKEV